jgi:hypothetical protein
VIHGPGHDNIFAEREKIVNERRHVRPNVALPFFSRCHVGSSSLPSAPRVKFAMTSLPLWPSGCSTALRILINSLMHGTASLSIWGHKCLGRYEGYRSRLC